MGNIFLGGCLLLLLAAACAVSDPWRKEVAAEPDPLRKGQILYENSCNRCHALYMPTSYTRGDWRHYVRKYTPRARLSRDEGALIYFYLRTNAHDAE